MTEKLTPKIAREEQKYTQDERAPLASIAELADFIMRRKQEVNYEMLIDPTVRVAAFGEVHTRYGPKEEITKNLETFKKMGFSHLGLEYFTSDLQNALDDYCEKGTEESKQKLVQHLTDRWASYHPRFIDMCFQMIDAAHKIGLRVRAINRKSKENEEKTDQAMTDAITAVLEQNQNYKIITLCGRIHVQNSPDCFITKLKEKYAATAIQMSGGQKGDENNIFALAAQQSNTDQEKWTIPGPDYCDRIIHLPQQEEPTSFERATTTLKKGLKERESKEERFKERFREHLLRLKIF